jgi:chromosome segregation ATPase
VTYITDDELDQLPDDPLLRFVGIEKIVRERYEAAANRLDQEDTGVHLMRRYMSLVLPAAKRYNVPGLQEWRRPSTSEDSWEYYSGFFADVDYATTDIRLQRAERLKISSVKLDAATKIKLRHLTTEIRETVDKLDVSVRKKERLYERLAELDAEINRDRTRYEAIAAMLIEACDDAGEAAKRLEPVVRLVERVGAAIGVAKRDEDAQARLPPPADRKRIEDKTVKPKTNGGNFDKQLDDEIPF